MKLKLVMVVLSLFLFAGFAGVAAAKDKKATHQKARSLTGCLSNSDEAKEFNLTTAQGATWEVKSDAVDLAPHVGHTVTLTGVVRNAAVHGMKEDAKEEAKEHGMDKDSKEHGHMTVTDVKMVSESCKK